MRFVRSEPWTPQDPVIGWLLDSDPAIRWQVMRDLLDALGLHLSSFRHFGDELAVNPIHHPLQHRELFRRFRPRDRERVSELPGLHAIEGDAHIVREFLHIELQSEYAN